MGEVRHLGEFGGLVPPPYRFVAGSLALLVFVCLAPLHSPYWGAATQLKYKKTYLTLDFATRKPYPCGTISAFFQVVSVATYPSVFQSA